MHLVHSWLPPAKILVKTIKVITAETSVLAGGTNLILKNRNRHDRPQCWAAQCFPTNFPLIDQRMLSPMVLPSCALTAGSADIPVVIFLSDILGSKGLCCSRYCNSFLVSELSFIILVLILSLCWSLVEYVISVSYCIALLISAQAGMDSTHTRRCSSVIPSPLLNHLWY